MTTFFYQFASNLARCFKWRFLAWHVAAIVSTYFLVMSGFDWAYYSYFRHTTVYRVLFPAAPLGGLLPIAVPLALLIVGKAKGSFRVTNSAFAAGQAAISALLISSFYKAFTGRAHPMRLGSQLIDTSREFRFGFMKGGVFWGWPSSHTTVAFACAAALFVLYPDRKLVRLCAAAVALYIGLGVSMSIHWFSDFAAGAMIGTTIGIVTGRSFEGRNEDLITGTPSESEV
jgi:membrane-associated phospholipid phosphatase